MAHSETKCIFCGVFVRKNHELIRDEFQKPLHANNRQHYYIYSNLTTIKKRKE